MWRDKTGDQNLMSFFKNNNMYVYIYTSAHTLWEIKSERKRASWRKIKSERDRKHTASLNQNQIEPPLRLKISQSAQYTQTHTHTHTHKTIQQWNNIWKKNKTATEQEGQKSAILLFSVEKRASVLTLTPPHTLVMLSARLHWFIYTRTHAAEQLSSRATSKGDSGFKAFVCFSWD